MYNYRLQIKLNYKNYFSVQASNILALIIPCKRINSVFSNIPSFYSWNALSSRHMLVKPFPSLSLAAFDAIILSIHKSFEYLWVKFS
jgi:hypothetical protein